MTAVEITLLLIGFICMIGSFFITEHLSQSEITKIADLTEKELKIVMNRELAEAKSKVSDMVDNSVDLSLDQIQRSLEKETNEKIMAINEYSDTVMESMNKSHNEVMFLYSMLNDKHGELTEMTSQMQQLISEAEHLTKTSEKSLNPVEDQDFVKLKIPVVNQEEEKILDVPVMEEKEQDTDKQTEENGTESNREAILSRYHNGEELVEIAKSLGLGLGEVKLIVGLYNKGEEVS